MKRVKIGKLVLGHPPRIVASVGSLSVLKRVTGMSRGDFDIVEVRLDLMEKKGGWEEVCRKIKKVGIPVLLTVRSAREGGKWTGRERDRKALLADSLDFVSAVDIELGSRIAVSVIEAAHQKHRPIIASFHDFDATPSFRRLCGIAERARKKGADVVKMATRINRKADMRILESVLREISDEGPVCLIGMGPKGVDSRVSLACEDSCLTYGFLGRSAAPGQWPCRKLAAALRARNCRS